MPSPDERSALGLRERKKAKTRAEIQRQALRLFREQGYEATPVSQIAAAAEIAESTFFRYFPTKEEVVLWDEIDPYLIEVFKAQPAALSPIQALRVMLRAGLAKLTAPGQSEDLRARVVLMLTVTPLRATLIDLFGGPRRLLAEAVAERTGRRPDDPAVRTLVGAVVGVALSVLYTAVEDPDVDIAILLDKELARLESGLAL
jgi:AcrR family transcriptional regulator